MSEYLPVIPEAPILVTGGGGFIGRKVVANLQARGFSNIRCFTRRSKTGPSMVNSPVSGVQFVVGNLLSKTDCLDAVRGVRVIYHLAAGTGTKSIADAFLNSVVTTRNLIEAGLASGTLLRFVNVSSFAVYSNCNKPNGNVLDENCPLREHPERWGDAYAYAKLKQDLLVEEYARTRGLSYTHIRPGAVYGPGKRALTGRVGLGTFGVFLHLGGSGKIPFTYVDNCAEAIVLAGLKENADRQVFNVVDDDLPTSRQFLRLYKENVRHFRSIYLPAFASYWLCLAWEKYATASRGQLPPGFNREIWHAQWKRTLYSNDKLKRMLGWTPQVPMHEGLRHFFADCQKEDSGHA